jgi:hypothetical protein
MAGDSEPVDELQRLKNLVPKVEPVTPGIRPSSSLRNLVNTSKEKGLRRFFIKNSIPILKSGVL